MIYGQIHLLPDAEEGDFFDGKLNTFQRNLLYMTGVLKTDGIWVDAANIKSPQVRVATTAKKAAQVWYNVYGPEVGVYAIGIEIDGDIVQTATVQIGDKRVGKDKVLWFDYPDDRKSIGAHKVVFKTGYFTELPNGKTETTYTWESPVFEVIIE